MKKLLLLTLACVFCFNMTMQAQTETLEDLKSMVADKQAAIDALTGEMGDLNKKITEFPGWKYGGVGIVGFDLNSNSDWFSIANPNSSSSGYGISASAFANLDQDKYFWRNLLTANLKRNTTILDGNVSIDDDASNEIQATTDILDISSLGGYKLTSKWALSAEGKYSTGMLNINRPGKLTVSAGATWLPIDNMVVVIHPLGYEKNWPGDFISSLGAKIGVQYAAEIIPNVSWSTNLSAFLPYGSGDATFLQHAVKNADISRSALRQEFDLGSAGVNPQAVALGTGDLTNWTWINSFSTSIFKGVGVGFNIGLKKDKQVSTQSQYERFDDAGTFNIDNIDNPLQLYYSLGLSYTL